MLQSETQRATASPPHTNATPGPQSDRTEFDQLLDTLYDATILADFAGNIITANTRAHDFFQLEAAAFPQCHIAQLIEGANQDILEMIIQNITDRRFTLMQAYCIRADESTFPAEISVTAVMRNSQHCLCFSIRDITVRREVEEQLRIEGEAIRNSGDGIVITDTNNMITYSNPAVGRLWNRSPEEDLLGQEITTLFSASQGIEEALQTVANEGSWNGELEGLRLDQQPLYLQTGITVSSDENDCVTHLIYSFTDITRRRQGEMALVEYQNHLEELIRERTTDLESTNREMMREIKERREVEEQLRDAIRQLREHDKAKNLFVSNVSHELRTPLTSLISSLENLMRGIVGEVPPSVASYFNMMLEDCWRLERTINDILDLTRLEKGTFKLERRLVPFSRLMYRASESIRMSADAIPLEFHINHINCPGYFDGDAAKIERVLINILSNALKFTPPPGSCTVHLHQLTLAGKTVLACDVTDSGIGIPPEFLPRVTERFFRIGEQVEGTGLGLAIARETIEKHGGGIDIASPPPDMPRGTRVRIWIPKHTPPTILLTAPPEQDQYQKLSEALRVREYTTHTTSRGAEAIQYLRDNQMNAALIGPNLDDMSGTELIMHIMADPALRTMKLFFLAEQRLDQAKIGLLQGFDIPHLLLQRDVNKLIDSMEDSFLPDSRPHSSNHVINKKLNG